MVKSSALVAAIAASAYLNGLHGDWLDDDPVAITNNPDADCANGNWHGLISNDFWGQPLESASSHLSFRPLTTLSFRLQNCFVGFHAASFHAVNVALHSLVCVLLHCALAGPILDCHGQRLFASLLFALHAVHVEVVTNTVGRAELLSAVFSLLAILEYRRIFLLPTTAAWLTPPPGTCSLHVESRRSRSLLLLACVVALAGAAMFCKEVGLTAILVCAAIDVAMAVRILAYAVSTDSKGAPLRQRLHECFSNVILPIMLRVALLTLGGIALLAARLWINGWRSPQFTSADNAAAFCPSCLCRILSYSHLYFINLRLLLLPTNLAHDWSMTTVPNMVSLEDPRLPLAALPYTLLLAISLTAVAALQREVHIHCHRQRPQKRPTLSSAPAFGASLFMGLLGGLAWLVLPFLPASGAFVTPGFTIAERVLYLPSVGACLLLAVLLGVSRRRAGANAHGHRLAVASRRLAPLLLFVMHAVLTLRRNVDWRTNLSLLESGAAHQPTNSKLAYNLGIALYRYSKPPRYSEALVHLRRARQLLPTFYEAAVVEAALLREPSVGQSEEAKALLRDTIRRCQQGDADMEMKKKAEETPLGGLAGRASSSFSANSDTVSDSTAAIDAPSSSSADAAIAQMLSRERAQQHRQGLYYASRGLADLLEAEAAAAPGGLMAAPRAAEALAALMPALALTPADEQIARQALRLAREAGDEHAEDLLSRHLRRLRLPSTNVNAWAAERGRKDRRLDEMKPTAAPASTSAWPPQAAAPAHQAPAAGQTRKSSQWASRLATSRANRRAGPGAAPPSVPS